MSSCTYTPTSKQKKRNLSSPFDNLNNKRLSAVAMDPEKTSTTNVSFGQEDLEKIADVLKSSFQNEILALVEHAVKSSVSAIVDGVLSGLECKIKLLESENTRLTSENESLKVQVNTLKATADSAEQYSRRNNIRIAGYPESSGENTDQIVLDICKQLNVDMNVNEIDRSHRTGKRTGSGPPRPIIVKFISYRARQRLLKARSGLKSNDMKNIYFNEDLTKQRNFAMYNARLLAKSNKIDSCWTFDGLIYVKDTNQEVHRITNSDDLVRFDR
jgi:hypothetical protein